MVIRAGYMVGCDGGRSPVREALGLSFDGKTAPNQWIVVDVEDDPIGTPNIYLGCDPKRPYVSAALPHGIRRFEFMVMPGETEQHFREPGVMDELLAKLVDKPGEVKVIRQRVYNHNSRLASRFRVDRVLLAGDAAHIMPVWQGTGLQLRHPRCRKSGLEACHGRERPACPDLARQLRNRTSCSRQGDDRSVGHGRQGVQPALPLAWHSARRYNPCIERLSGREALFPRNAVQAYAPLRSRRYRAVASSGARTVRSGVCSSSHRSGAPTVASVVSMMSSAQTSLW